MVVLKRRLGYLFPLFMLALAILACDVDRNMGTLAPNATPVTFEGAVGCLEIWRASVTPNTQYTIILTPLDGGEGDRVSLDVRATGANDTPRTFNLGHAESRDGSELQITFIGPSNGEVRILVTASSRDSFTIQLLETDN
jgi:hypothetical protein